MILSRHYLAAHGEAQRAIISIKTYFSSRRSSVQYNCPNDGCEIFFVFVGQDFTGKRFDVNYLIMEMGKIAYKIEAVTRAVVVGLKRRSRDSKMQVTQNNTFVD